MKKLFLFLLKKYTKDEKDRLVVFSILHEQVQNTYNEQSAPGQVYAAQIEFLMSSKPIVKGALENDRVYLDMIKGGLATSFDHSIAYIIDEHTISLIDIEQVKKNFTNKH